MSGDYTKKEIAQRVSQITDKTVSLDRVTFASSDFIVDSIKAMVAKTIDSDPDAIYYLVKLFAIAQSKLCSQILTSLDAVERLSFIGQGEVPLSDPDRLTEILVTLDAMAESDSLPEMNRLKSLLANQTKSLRQDSKRQDGSLYSGVDPSEARDSAELEIQSISTNMATLESGVVNYLRVIQNYNDSQLSRFTIKRLAQEARKLFTQYVISNQQSVIDIRLSGRARTNLLGPIRDASIVSSIFNRRGTGVTQGGTKFDGAVTTVGKNPAVSVGGTLPFSYPIYHSVAGDALTGSSVTLEVDGSTTGTITSGFTERPSLRFTYDITDFYRLDGGVFAQGRGIQALAPANVYTTDVVFNTNTPRRLKCYVDKTSIVIRYTDVNGSLRRFGPPNPTSTYMVDLNSISAAPDRLEYTLNQDQGELSLDFNPPAVPTYNPADYPKDDTPIEITYRYFVLGNYKAQYYDNQNAIVHDATATYGDFKFLIQNVVASVSPAGMTAGDYKSFTSSLSAAIQASAFSSLVTVGNSTSSGFNINRLDAGGSGNRLTYPNYATASLNTAPFAPTWVVAPSTINQALGAISSSEPQSFGSDIELSDLTVSSSIADKVSLGTSEATRATGLSGTAQASDLGVTINGISSTGSIGDGDTIELTSPYIAKVKVLTVTSGTSITVNPSIALNLTGDVVQDTPVQFNVTRNTLTVTSSSLSKDSKLTFSNPSRGGFGLTGSSFGSSNHVTLSSDNKSAPVRGGDVVKQSGSKIGTVSSKNGTSLKLNLDTNVSISYPMTSLTIESRGESSYNNNSSSVSSSGLELTKLLTDSRHVDKLRAFTQSGTSASNFLTSVQILRSAVTDVKSAYDAYEANSVREVDSLIRVLDEEKMTLVLEHLRNLDFVSIEALTAEELSNQTSMENLLEEMSSVLAGGAFYAEIIEGDTRMSDYFTRGDGNQIDEFGQE